MRKAFKILFFLWFLFMVSCVSLRTKHEDDYYVITNKMLDNTGKSRDSIYIINWKEKKRVKNNNLLNDFNSFKRFKRFKRFLAEQGINYDKELPYFKKQLKNTIDLDKNKIENSKTNIFPVGTDIHNLNFDKNYAFTGYYYNLYSIVFTKDRKNAIAYRQNKNSTKSIIHFKKTNGIWKSTFEFSNILPLE